MRGKSVRLISLALALLLSTGFVACRVVTPPPAQSSGPSQNVSETRAATSPGRTPGRSPASGSSPEATVSSAGPPASLSGTGTVVAARYANLSFGTGGKVTALEVKEGDHVTKGMVLGKLETTSLEVALVQAKVSLNQAKMAQTQALINLISAQITLDKTRVVSDVNDEITDLQWAIKIAENEMLMNPAYWTKRKASAQDSLAEKKERLSALLGHSTNASAVNYISKQYSSSVIEDVRMKALQVEYGQLTSDKALGSIDQAVKNLALAQQQLEQATITAPFDGLVFTVNYKAGDVVPAPSQAQPPVIYIIDPVIMELVIGINELDVSKVKTGQPAIISIDAFPGAKINGNVTAISNVPTVQGGMVNFNVKITFSVPPNIEVRAGMNGTAQVIEAEAVTTPGSGTATQSHNTSTSTPSAQSSGSTSQVSTTLAASPTAGTVPGVQNPSVSGTGTMSATTYANLIFGTGGKLKDVQVKEGDRVTAGMVLARLDTISLESSLAQAKATFDQAELGLTQANVSLKTAQFNLDKSKAASNIKRQIVDLQWNIKVAEMGMGLPENSSGTGSPAFTVFQDNITAKKKELTDLLAQPEYSGLLGFDMVGEKYDTLTTADLKNKELQVEYYQRALDKAQDTFDLAGKSLSLAQQQMDEATIAAPFSGVVATINYKPGDIVPSPSQTQRAVIYLINLSTMELEIVINELDVPSVKIGQPASISVDAFPGIKLDGKVAAISMVPTIQGGIVDYSVTITFSVPPNVPIRVGMNATAQITVK